MWRVDRCGELIEIWRVNRDVEGGSSCGAFIQM